MTKTLYRIKYTDRLTGKRCSYMDIGFETPEQAQIELDKLIRESKNKEYSTDQLTNLDPVYLRTWMVGSDWKIESFKCTID